MITTPITNLAEQLSDMADGFNDCPAVLHSNDIAELKELLYAAATAIEAKQQGPGEDDRKGMLIGNLLDHWEGTPNDLKSEVREFGCGKQLDDLLRYMQEEQPLPKVEAKRQTGEGDAS